MEHPYAIKRTRSYAVLIAFSCLAVLCAVMVFNSLTQDLNQDEEQFIAAAYFVQDQRLYTDFLYLQMPIYPLVLSKLLTVFSILLSPFQIARLLSAALAIGTVVIFFSLAVRAAKSVPFAFILASLFASAPLMQLAYGSARNDIMPIFFGLCGVWFTLRGLDAQRKQPDDYLAVFLAGFCMAVAVGAKVTAAFIPLTTMLYLSLRARLQLLPFVLGGALGSLPILYYAATAFDEFLYGNVTFHLTTRQEFYSNTGQAEILTWPYRAKSVALAWLSEPTLVVASLFVAFVVFIAWRRGLLFRKVGTYLLPNKIFIILLVPAAIPFVFLPNPFAWTYLQPAVPYVLLTCAALFPLVRKIFESRQIFVFAAMAIIVLALQIGRFVTEARRNLSPPLWPVAEIHQISAVIAGYAKGGAVATLYPALVLDAGTPVYPEFASSPYFFRAGDHLAPERISALKGITPRTLPLVFAARPPIAVFAGNTADDFWLLNWARHNCYVEVDLAERKGDLYDEKWKPRLFMRPHEQVSCGDKR